MESRSEMRRDDVQQKVEEYRGFLDSTLRPQLAEAKEAKRVVEDEMKEYQDLLDRLPKMKDLSTMTVDLGWDKAYCEAKIPPDAKIFVDVGMGFHVEFTSSEATDFIRKRLHFLQEKLRVRKSRLRKVEEHVSTAEDILDHLSNEALSLP